MDKIEARDVLVAYLSSFRTRRYGDLVDLIGHVQVAEVVGSLAPSTRSRLR